jgi:hypothetical protein
MTERNLWGDIPLGQPITPPIVILRAQAEYLTRLTGSVVEGRVAARQNGESVELMLNALVPAMNYSLPILTISHPITLYPAHVTDLRSGNPVKRCGDEATLVEALGTVLSSPSVHQLVAALVAQSRVMRE